MEKISTFLAEGDHGYSAIPLFGPADRIFEKVAAASLLPPVLDYIASLKTRPGSQYVLVNAMGAGEYYGCFPAGTLVETDQGEVAIELIQPGALVRTHLNRFRAVRAAVPRAAEELCDLYAQGLPSNLPSLTATPNHELWAVTREEFLRAQRAHIWYGDTQSPLLERRERALTDMAFSWVPVASMRPGDYIAEPFPLEEDAAALGDEKWNTPEVAFLMGLYAAEGRIARRYDRDDERPASIIYVIGGDEGLTVVEARRCAEALAHGLQDYPSDSGTSYRLQLCFAALARLCEEHVGTPSTNKKLSSALLRMPRAWQRVFFDAYAGGDGCVRGPGKEEGTVRCVSASAALLRGVRLLLARLGLAASISGRHNKKASWYNGNAIFELSVSGGQLRGRSTSKSYLHPAGFILSSAKKVRQYEWSGTVYDLEVDEDASFTASGVSVHNSNINGDHFEEAGLIHCPPGWTNNPLIDRAKGKDWTYGYPTFYNAYPFAHHRNKDPSKAYGEVELSVWNDNMKRVELVCRVDRDKCEQFGGTGVWDRLQTGQFPDVSMGSKVCYDLSSITTDWEEYKKALATFDPKKHAYPGLAVVEVHNRLKKERGHGIRGLSITRVDYDEWTKNHMNRILPDGRKVFVYNPYPRFFDISFVFIGADRTAKVMVHIAKNEKTASAVMFKTASVSSASAELEKTAGVYNDILKNAFVRKNAEIKKEISPTQFGGKAVPLIAKSDKDIPEWAIDALSKVPLTNALSTTGGMGLVLKPREFQRIVMIRLGKKDEADDLDAHDEIFPKTDDEHPVGMSTDSFMPALAKLLMPLLEGRSGLAPHVEGRLIIMSSGHHDGAEKKASSHSSVELRKIGAAYNGYRRELMTVVASAQDLLQRAAPQDGEVQKLASASAESLFTPLSYAYFAEAYLDEVPFPTEVAGW